MLSAGTAWAQTPSSMEDALRQLKSPNARGYLQPMADLFAADMSSGWYRGANITSLLSVSLELVGSVSKIEDKHRVYLAEAPDGFSRETFETATVFGGQGTLIMGPNGTSYRGSDGVFGGDYLPALVPQIRVGFANTEGIVRYFSSSFSSSLPTEGFPETRLIGFGLRHGLNRYLGALPVDVAAGVFYSKLDVGNSNESGARASYSGLTFGLQASKSLAGFTLYFGAASDGGTMNLSYESTNAEEPGPVDIDLTVQRKMRFTTGASIGLGFLRIGGDINIGPTTSFSGGIRVGI